MIKTAIFVEGHTELIFFREYLLKMFDYHNIWVECYTLFTDNTFNTTEYALKNEHADYYFQIINVGNDNAVLSRILRREQNLWNNGFQKIFGVRDMYSKQYRELVQNAQISESLNQKFIDSIKTVLKEKAQNANAIYFQFAIMEVEAWFLGFKDCFNQIDEILTTNYIESCMGINIDEIDPETTFFHPASVVSQIYELGGKIYSKSKGDISAFMNVLQKEDFIKLADSDKCHSFKSIHSLLIA